MQSYRSFLMKIGTELLDAVREAENLEWHHLDKNRAEWLHYVRLGTWLAQVAERLGYYDDIKAKNRPPERKWTPAQDVVDRYLDKRIDAERDPRQLGFDGDPKPILEARVDLSEDDS